MSTAVLSIDGGGMKGIISAKVLVELENLIQQYSQNSNARIGDYFDLIAGTSTGSILTALYLTPENGHPKYSAKQILDFYLTLGPSIFQKQSLYPLFGSKYMSRDFEKTLTDIIGTIRISDLLKPCLIASYDTTARKAIFFNTETGRKDASRNYLVADAVRASCAAPTYYPPVCLTNPPVCPSCYVDGGVVANNPSLCALIEALKLPRCTSIHDIYLMSVGNIKNDTSYFYREVKKWGLIEWAAPLFSILLNSNEQTVDYQLNSLFQEENNHYLRLQVNSLEKTPDMDDYSKETIEFLLTSGDELIETRNEELKNFAYWLVTRKNT